MDRTDQEGGRREARARRGDDRAWLVATVAVATVLFGSTIGTNVEFGDSAEALAGVHDLGIVHAPGYFSFTVLARAFATVVPIGDLAFRVALFSTVCALGTIAAVFGIARRLGASGPGAAAGALLLATGTTFWFDAGYAKAYAFTSLLIAGALWCALEWKDSGNRVVLAAFGAAIGISLGASWQSMAVALPGLAVLLWAADRRPSGRDLAVIASSGLAMAAIVAIAVLVRASMDPRVNWGDASNVRRLGDLLLMRDFVNLQGGAGAGGSAPVASGSAVGALASKLLRVPTFVLADSGVAFLVLLLVGLAAAAGHRAATRFWVLATMLVTNFVAVSLVIAPGVKVKGFKIDREALLRFGGYQLAAGIASAALAAIGATWLLERSARWLAGGQVGDRRGRRRPPADVRVPAWLAACVFVLVAGTAAWNWNSASHHQPPFARDYARNVLDSLPPDAVLVSLVAERSFPIQYEQVVHHSRPDVTVVQVEALAARWYRGAVSDALGVDVRGIPSPNDAALRLVDRLRGRRPVFYDYAAATSLSRVRPNLGFTKIGLVAEAQPDGAGQNYDHIRAEQLLARFRVDGLRTDRARLRWPNDTMLLVYAAAHYDEAVALAREGRTDEARAELRTVLAVGPGNPDATKALAALGQPR